VWRLKELGRFSIRKLTTLRKKYIEFEDEKSPNSTLDEIAAPESTIEEADPLNRLGYGVLSYFIVMRTLLFAFFCLSLCFLPLIRGYAHWDSTDIHYPASTSLIDKPPFGNLGESAANCEMFYHNTHGHVHLLGCQAGLITEVTQVGVYQEDSDAAKHQICTTQTRFDTGIDCPDLTHMTTYIKDSCLNKDACVLDSLASTIPKTCPMDQNSVIFVQFNCIQSDEDVFTKRKMALQASCLTLFTTLAILWTIYSSEKQHVLNEQLWDL